VFLKEATPNFNHQSANIFKPLHLPYTLTMNRGIYFAKYYGKGGGNKNVNVVISGKNENWKKKGFLKH